VGKDGMGKDGVCENSMGGKSVTVVNRGDGVGKDGMGKECVCENMGGKSVVCCGSNGGDKGGGVC